MAKVILREMFQAIMDCPSCGYKKNKLFLCQKHMKAYGYITFSLESSIRAEFNKRCFEIEEVTIKDLTGGRMKYTIIAKGG